MLTLDASGRPVYAGGGGGVGFGGGGGKPPQQKQRVLKEHGTSTGGSSGGSIPSIPQLPRASMMGLNSQLSNHAMHNNNGRMSAIGVGTLSRGDSALGTMTPLLSNNNQPSNAMEGTGVVVVEKLKAKIRQLEIDNEKLKNHVHNAEESIKNYRGFLSSRSDSPSSSSSARSKRDNSCQTDGGSAAMRASFDVGGPSSIGVGIAEVQAESVRRSLDSALSTVNKLQQEKEDLNNRLAVAREESRLAAESITQRDNQIDDISRQLRSKDNRLRTLEAQQSAASIQETSKMQEIQENAEKQRIQEKHERQVQIEKQVHCLKALQSQCQQTRTDLRAIKTTFVAEMTGCQQWLTQQQLSCQKLAHNQEQLETIVTLKATLANTQQKLRIMETSVESAEGQLEASRRLNETLSNSLDASKATAERLQTDLEELLQKQQKLEENARIDNSIQLHSRSPIQSSKSPKVSKSSQSSPLLLLPKESTTTDVATTSPQLLDRMQRQLANELELRSKYDEELAVVTRRLETVCIASETARTQVQTVRERHQGEVAAVKHNAHVKDLGRVAAIREITLERDKLLCELKQQREVINILSFSINTAEQSLAETAPSTVTKLSEGRSKRLKQLDQSTREKLKDIDQRSAETCAVSTAHLKGFKTKAEDKLKTAETEAKVALDELLNTLSFE